MAIPLPKSWKRSLKGRMKRWRLRYMRWRYGFGVAELESALRALGLDDGATVLVHVGWDRFEGFDGRPTDVIKVLESIVGESGTVVMPTLPFVGSALEWVERGQPFHIKRTPSRMGMVTELFRRMPGVVRSLHPTHSVAARGARARALCNDHQRAQTPCGKHSPYMKLVQEGGKILFLGPTIESMTCFHAVEALLEASMPQSPFTKEWYTLPCLDGDEQEHAVTTRLFDATLSRQRRISMMIPALKREEAWHALRMGRVDMLLLDAVTVRKTLEGMAREGRFCYDGFSTP
ncbi:MAG: AAC(3) family N-acetyltransferase [Magnetococcales bacterium]|nr:AAC(3) family N-acetyltransferase [Magnetococcales bacterium]